MTRMRLPIAQFFALVRAVLGDALFDIEPGVTYNFGVLSRVKPADVASDVARTFAPTFSTYLNESLSDYGTSFTTTGFNHLYGGFAALNISLYPGFPSPPDFWLADPGFLTCFDSIYGVDVIASRRNLVDGVELRKYGGVWFTKADNDEISELADLNEKKVSIVMLSLGSGVLQDNRMESEGGVGIATDLAQMLFNGDEYTTVEDVLINNYTDAGAVQTGTLESFVAKGYINASDYKIFAMMDVGADFPLNTSTALWSEWAVFAMPWVPTDVKKAVAAALMSPELNSSHPAAIAGGYAAWDPPYSYSGVQDQLRSVNYYPDGSNTCNAYDFTALLANFQCPDGYARINFAYLATRCSDLGTPC
ncbi:unnamed protein product, partial [Phaeothamnion confervicola]